MQRFEGRVVAVTDGASRDQRGGRTAERGEWVAADLQG